MWQMATTGLDNAVPDRSRRLENKKENDLLWDFVHQKSKVKVNWFNFSTFFTQHPRVMKAD